MISQVENNFYSSVKQNWDQLGLELRFSSIIIALVTI